MILMTTLGVSAPPGGDSPSTNSMLWPDGTVMVWPDGTVMLWPDVTSFSLDFSTYVNSMYTAII